MMSPEFGSAALTAFVAVAELAKILNGALNHGQSFEVVSEMGHYRTDDGGYRFSVTIKAPGEKPTYPPCGLYGG